MKIVRTDRELTTPLVDQVLVNEGHDLVLLPDGVAEDRLVDEARDADLILMCYTPITRRVIESAAVLKGIVKYGVGIDAIDISAAIERNIPVVNIPEYAEETVAEGAFAMMLALAKKLPALDRHMKQTGWAWPEPNWLASDISGKTVGVVGFGKIGRSFARMAGQGFNANVLVYDPGKSAENVAAAGARKVEDLHAMLVQCDFLSVHAVLREDTRHMIGAEEIGLLKPTAIVINAARGALIDETALRDALLSGNIAGAGLDVFSSEPLALKDHPLSALFHMENVMLTPHLTFYSTEAMERLEIEILERCREVLEGRNVTVKSTDSRLRAQTSGVKFVA